MVLTVHSAPTAATMPMVPIVPPVPAATAVHPMLVARMAITVHRPPIVPMVIVPPTVPTDP